LASPHELLAAFCGSWRGLCRTCHEEGVISDESPWAGTIRLMLKDRFAVHEYEASCGGEAFSGVMTMGYCKARERWELAWTDSAHTGTAIQYSTGGAWVPGSKSFEVSCTYADGQGGPEWGWRTVVTLETPDRLSIRQYNSMPEGTPAGGVFTIYERV
jgi:Protein of unknown function (DUF1579)